MRKMYQNGKTRIFLSASDKVETVKYNMEFIWIIKTKLAVFYKETRWTKLNLWLLLTILFINKPYFYYKIIFWLSKWIYYIFVSFFCIQ